MRIISGRFRGHRFDPPADRWPTRPTTDFAKEGLFNMLANRLDFEDMVMLDLFGGTGNHSFECISRGCENATYVDRFMPCVRFVKRQSATWGIEDCMTIHRMDAFDYIRSTNLSFTYIFAGPPYDLPNLDDIPDRIFEAAVLTPGGLFVLEHNPKHDFHTHVRFEQMRHYGQTQFSFFRLRQT